MTGFHLGEGIAEKPGQKAHRKDGKMSRSKDYGKTKEGIERKNEIKGENIIIEERTQGHNYN